MKMLLLLFEYCCSLSSIFVLEKRCLRFFNVPANEFKINWFLIKRKQYLFYYGERRFCAMFKMFKLPLRSYGMLHCFANEKEKGLV